MFWELLAVLFAGFAGAGVALALNVITRGRMPKATMPIMAAAAMLLATISSEMTWFERSKAQLPDSVLVVAQNEKQNWYRPWTYVTPYVNRFAAADIGGAQSNENVPHQRIVDLYLLERWQPAQALQIGVDCMKSAQTPLSGAEFEDTGEITAGSWDALAPDDPLLVALCGEGGLQPAGS